MAGKSHIRVFVDQPLTETAVFSFSPEQAHYIVNVMRLNAGDELLVFNGKEGEFLARIKTVGKRSVEAEMVKRTREFVPLADVTLAFAPVKRMHTDFIAQKATELGAACLQPVMTRRTVAERINTTRLRVNAIEAAEQCGLVAIPRIEEPVQLEKLIAFCETRRDENVRLMFCDESGESQPVRAVLERETGASTPWIILVGPEGGFAPEERNMLSALPYARPVSLGPRIMRADTAALAALTIWQSVLGDWQNTTICA